MCEHWGSQGHSSTQLQDLQDAQHASDRAIAPAPEVVSDPCISSWTSSPFPSVSESGTGVLCSTPSSGCLCGLIQQGVGRCMVPLGPTEEVLTLGHSDICGLEQELCPPLLAVLPTCNHRTLWWTRQQNQPLTRALSRRTRLPGERALSVRPERACLH